MTSLYSVATGLTLSVCGWHLQIYQVKWYEVDFKNKMKNKLLVISVSLLAGLFVGCGGGGGGVSSSNNSNPDTQVAPVIEKSITIFDTPGQQLSLPKLMLSSSTGQLTVAAQGSDKVFTFDLSDGRLISSYSVNDPIGVAFKTGTSDVYYAAGSGVFTGGGSTIISNVAGNYYGLTFTSATDFYVGNISGSGTVVKYSVASQIPQDTIDQSNGLTGFPSALVSYNGFIYASLTDQKIVKIDPVTKVVTPLSWGRFDHPNGIVIDSGYAYIANNGASNNGDGGYISRVKLSDGTNEIFASDTVGAWKTSSTGFCGPAGVATYGGYLYVSNGTCASANGNQNKIFKIRIP
jgi:hypothetical protein